MRKLLLAMIFAFGLGACEEHRFEVKFQDSSVHQNCEQIYHGQGVVDFNCNDGYYSHVTNYQILSAKSTGRNSCR